jgi:hypothetical protein
MHLTIPGHLERLHLSRLVAAAYPNKRASLTSKTTLGFRGIQTAIYGRADLQQIQSVLLQEVNPVYVSKHSSIKFQVIRCVTYVNVDTTYTWMLNTPDVKCECLIPRSERDRHYLERGFTYPQLLVRLKVHERYLINQLHGRLAALDFILHTANQTN